jgi:hypothetical protein
VGEVSEAEGEAAEVFEAAADGFCGSVAGAGPVEVGEDVDGAALESCASSAVLARAGVRRRGLSVPFGLLVAGVTVPTALMNLVPKWIVVLGVAVAICGELSWLYLMVSGALPLVPLARFPGFVWIIAIALALPTSIEG